MQANGKNKNKLVNNGASSIVLPAGQSVPQLKQELASKQGH